MQRPIFISGRVLLSDGSPPPETVVIERVCNGQPRPEAYTDSKGRFSFELGRNNLVFHDASVSGIGGGPGMPGALGGNSGGFGRMGGGVSERDLIGCELRATLPGFRSDIVSLAQRRTFDNPDVGTIILHRLGQVEGRIISATSLAAPKDARKAFEKAQDQVKNNKPNDALKNLQKAVQIYPKYAAAWLELGKVQERQNQLEEAKKSYQQAVDADPRYINPHLQLALVAAKERNWKELANATERALKLDPYDYPQAYFYHSVASFNLQNLDAAEKSAREAQKLDPRNQFPKINHLLGVILAERRDYSGAAEQMRNYLKLAPKAQDADTVRSQLAELEKLAGGGTGAAPQQ
jgi:tetratricopeptide (TPR) repeat protein